MQKWVAFTIVQRRDIAHHPYNIHLGILHGVQAFLSVSDFHSVSWDARPEEADPLAAWATQRSSCLIALLA
jgi:hypothetical protein